jgi:hypothetical protein
MRTVLICHAEDRIGRDALARWLASFSELGGIVAIHEQGGRMWRRVRREVQRVGVARFLDVAAFRLYYALKLRASDRRWECERLAEVESAYPPLPADVRTLDTPSPNSIEAVRFVKGLRPDLIVARCKTLLSRKVFEVPPQGTFVMHPGICPEYRNAHGCFWALARNDLDNVGVTLLRIDRGVDTGPVYAYFRCRFDEVGESHIVIQNRMVLDNLEAIQAKLLEISSGRAEPLDTTGRSSAEWGQPWLTAYLAWKHRARRRL